MRRDRKLLGLCAAIAAFVVGVAIWTRNPGLFILAPLALFSGWAATRRKG